ncbi:MAG TPA: hypothetical protein VGC14_02655 [Rhizobium sp.]
MATVIDALLVTLSLDPSQFNKGQKDAAAAFLKTRQEAEKSGKGIEDAAKKSAEGIAKLAREVLGLYAIFVGARGIKEFVADLVSADAALGRFSRNLDTSPQTLAAWGNAAERMGGSAEATAGTFERIGKALYDLHRNGQMLPKEYSQLQALTGLRIDRDHGVDKFLQDTAAALQKMNSIDPAQAHFLASGMGIDDATANVMIKYGSAIGAYIDQIKKLSPSNDAIRAAQELQDKWNTLQQTAVSLANTILNTLGPEIAKLLTQMTAWVDRNQDWIKSGIVEALKNFVEYLRSIDWNAVGQGLSQFAAEAKHVGDAVGGITTAVEVLFGLWVGAKFLQVLANARLLAATMAGGSGAGAAGAGSVGGLLARIFGVAGAAYMLTDTAAGPSQSKINAAEKNAWYNRPSDASGHADALQNNPALGGGVLGNGRDGALDAFLSGDTKVDGRPVSKSNPLPVAMADNQSGGGFWSNLFSGIGNAVKSFVAPSANASLPPGGGGSSGGGAGSGSADWGKLYHGSGGSRSWRNNNPGNIEYGSYSRSKGAIGTDGRFAVFPSYEAGRKAQEDLLFNSKGYRNLTLGQAINKWAPAGDNNNVPAYIGALVAGSGVSPDTRMSDIPSDVRGKILDAMQKHEGWHPGTKKAAGIASATGASMSASLSTISNDNRSANNTSSHNVSIGSMNINAPQATDAQGIADKATDALYRSTVAATANYGPR